MKNSKYSMMYLEFLSGIWLYWSNLHVPPTVCLFCFGRFIFQVILSCTLFLLISYCYRAAPTGGNRTAPSYQLFLACKFFTGRGS